MSNNINKKQRIHSIILKNRANSNSNTIYTFDGKEACQLDSFQINRHPVKQIEVFIFIIPIMK